VTPFVKICGNADRQDVEAVARLAPDAMGFILWPGSRRYVPPEQLKEWLPSLPATIRTVGVFVDATPEEVDRVMRLTGLQIAQLHGREDARDYAGRPWPCWKVARVPPEDPVAAGRWPVDAILVDSYSPDAPGGTGRVGDWKAAAAFVPAVGKKVLLAGGLTPDNVRDAVRAVCPWGVDVSSGVETQPGRKDLAKVKRFIELCRSL